MNYKNLWNYLCNLFICSKQYLNPLSKQISSSSSLCSFGQESMCFNFSFPILKICLVALSLSFILIFAIFISLTRGMWISTTITSLLLDGYFVYKKGKKLFSVGIKVLGVVAALIFFILLVFGRNPIVQRKVCQRRSWMAGSWSCSGDTRGPETSASFKIRSNAQSSCHPGEPFMQRI